MSHHPHETSPPNQTESFALEKWGEREHEVHDASRRTRLANERTYLAWWRTGLTSLVVGLGAGKLVPAVASGAQWPFVVLGVGFASIGIVFMVYAFIRHKQVEEAVARGEFVSPEERLLVVLTMVGVLFGLLVLVLIVTQSG